MTKTHGYFGTRTYYSWASMLSRCRNPKNIEFHNYGGRGIKVCNRWKRFENFLADMGERPKGMTLDRINGDRNYEPLNCRWATLREQGNNSRRNHWLEWNGSRKTVAQWAETLQVRPYVLYKRLYRGWTIERTLETPV
jgi:hypothetical protein